MPAAAVVLAQEKISERAALSSASNKMRNFYSLQQTKMVKHVPIVFANFWVFTRGPAGGDMTYFAIYAVCTAQDHPKPLKELDLKHLKNQLKSG